jgi:hypothetical protein
MSIPVPDRRFLLIRVRLELADRDTGFPKMLSSLASLTPQRGIATHVLS